ncbi:MAG: Glutamine--scyllo-inositol transaminase [Bacteroidetes bacterium]|nr:Glutamine--scyllo-inositol transaminase [Bacteroidota bacterium]
MQVPFVSLRPVHDKLQKEIQLKLSALIEKSDFILGAEVDLFEKEYAQVSETKYCIGISNGLDALKISLKAAGIGKGDEVIVPANTYIASIFAILDAGATPVLAEPDKTTYNITAENIKSAITPRTKAVMPVHLYGQPCDMDAIMEMAEQNKILVIEDNAQAQGAEYKGRRTGSFGHMNATSFYPSKNLGAMGDAGAITTNSETLDRSARLLRNVGCGSKYHHEVVGYNARMDTMQAGVLNSKLPYLNEWNKERKEIASRYIHNLKECSSIILPEAIDGAEHVYHLFVIRLRERDALQQYLTQNEIQTLIHYPVPCHLQPALGHLGFKKGQFPVTEELSQTCLSLPVFIGMTESQIDFVSENIIAFDKQYS